MGYTEDNVKAAEQEIEEQQAAVREARSVAGLTDADIASLD